MQIRSGSIDFDGGNENNAYEYHQRGTWRLFLDFGNSQRTSDNEADEE